MIVKDTEVETIYGKIEFMQLVGITAHELNEIKADKEKIKVLYELMKKDNPFLVTDLNRTKSYL